MFGTVILLLIGVFIVFPIMVIMFIIECINGFRDKNNNDHNTDLDEFIKNTNAKSKWEQDYYGTIEWYD